MSIAVAHEAPDYRPAPPIELFMNEEDIEKVRAGKKTASIRFRWNFGLRPGRYRFISGLDSQDVIVERVFITRVARVSDMLARKCGYESAEAWHREWRRHATDGLPADRQLIVLMFRVAFFED